MNVLWDWTEEQQQKNIFIFYKGQTNWIKRIRKKKNRKKTSENKISRNKIQSYLRSYAAFSLENLLILNDTRKKEYKAVKMTKWKRNRDKRIKAKKFRKVWKKCEILMNESAFKDDVNEKLNNGNNNNNLMTVRKERTTPVRMCVEFFFNHEKSIT